MDEVKRAAIDLEEMQEKTLGEITGADLVTALNAGGIRGMHILQAWPEKKKVELLVEPENLSGIKFKDLTRGIREKKKVELEVPFKDRGGEFEQLDPGAPVINPAARVTLRDLQDMVAREVEVQLKGQR